MAIAVPWLKKSLMPVWWAQPAKEVGAWSALQKVHISRPEPSWRPYRGNKAGGSPAWGTKQGLRSIILTGSLKYPCDRLTPLFYV